MTIDILDAVASLTTENQSIASQLDESSLIRLAASVMKLFEHWQLQSKDQLLLLGLSPHAHRRLSSFRNGKPLLNTIDMIDRVGHLLAIHKNLRILFSHDRKIVYGWVHYPNKVFEGKAPLEIMASGFLGLHSVRMYLENSVHSV